VKCRVSLKKSPIFEVIIGYVDLPIAPPLISSQYFSLHQSSGFLITIFFFFLCRFEIQWILRKGRSVEERPSGQGVAWIIDVLFTIVHDSVVVDACLTVQMTQYFSTNYIAFLDLQFPSEPASVTLYMQ
jgi:hypothetical protein